MPSLMSMEDLFYGPPEQTWILPTPDDVAPPRRYIEREVIKEREIIDPPARRLREPNVEPLRPVARYVKPRPAPPAIEYHDDDIRPIERLARIHTTPEPLAIRAPHEEIRKVVEVPVPVPVEVHVPVEVPVEVHVPAPAAPPQVVVVEHNVTPPIQRPLVHHPIELKVPMCCEKCAKKVKDRLLDLEGVTNVVTDQYNQKVIVYGDADPARVLNRVKHVKKRSTFWDLTVDYSENYRRFRAAQAAEAREEAARAESARAKAAAAAAQAAESQAKLQRAVMQPSTVVVQLPQERNGPAVTAILPERKHAGTPYVVNSRIHSVRYESPPKAYVRDLFHGPPSQFYNGRHADRPSSVIY